MSENMSVDSKQEIGAKDPVELRSLPTRKYLDETVVPLLLEGLSILTKERPPTSEKAVEWLAAFLLKNKEYKSQQGVTSSH
ncbi:Oidioi.mRNA.OKI2018_I69.XSR.g13306.t1.cds [Oikopleura dioica]|uniref:Oidioi.mRNA.OKI2018_I69.XSR.g13306.t1.cds n=1 Tax=Oikopleura dioica TaxID=34765 RepID=A0ABN7S6H4_OIKDI|nr:Oidioi.mRNA.OKI2018_I69.XSR.g13306.t1.cds [Oikopleura dioica]